MKYMLITSKGKVFTFYIKDLALSYYYAYGGVLSVVSMQQESENCLTDSTGSV